MKRLGFITTAVIALVLPSETFAQTDISKEIAKCAAIEGDLERLECYDSLARAAGLVRKSTTTNVPGRGKWRVNEETNPIDDSKTVFLILVADEGEASLGRSIGLVLRCKSEKNEVYINWNDYLGSEAQVLTRLGSEQAKRQKWSLSTDAKATFYPGDDREFMIALLDVDRLVAQVTPYSESPTTAIFDVRGLDNAIVPLRTACGW